MQEHSYKNGSCALKICATKGVHPIELCSKRVQNGSKTLPNTVTQEHRRHREMRANTLCKLICGNQRVGGSSPPRFTTSFKELASSDFSLTKNCAQFCATPGSKSVPLSVSTALRLASMRMCE